MSKRASFTRTILAGIAASGMGIAARPSVGQGFIENPAYGRPRGPIPLRNERTYNLLFLLFSPESGDVLASGRTRFGAQLDVANNMLAPDPGRGSTVIEDNETQRLLLSWHRGLGRNAELAVFLPIVWRNGGFVDPILSAWHSIFGIVGNLADNPQGRNSFPDYQSVLKVVDPTGRTLVDAHNAYGPGDVTLTIKRALLRNSGRSAAAVRLGIKLPTGNPGLLLGSGNMDGGLSFDAQYALGRDLIVYGNLGQSWLGRPSALPNARQSMWQYVLALEYRSNNRDSWVFQLDGNRAPFITGNPFADRTQRTATFGFRRVLDRTHVLTAAVSENGDFHDYRLPQLSSIGPDFTISLGLEWHH